MAVDWQMAAVATALAIYAAPIAWNGVVKATTAVLKEYRRIIRLKWQDIPDGKVHDCDGTPGFLVYCLHSRPHITEERCWNSDSSIGTVFNRAWELSKRRPQYAENLPDALPTSAPFVCTDARTVLAFVLCTVGERRTRSWNSQLDCETWRGIRFCHIKGQFQNSRRDLKKSELERMLDGYPPWYRDTFVTRARVNLPFPIKDLPDVSRGGWIVAVGLMDSRESQSPLSLYRCENEPEEPGFRSNGVIFRQAIARCLEHITKNIQLHFQNDNNVNAAVTMLGYLIEERTGSGIPRPGQFGPRWNDLRPLPLLSGSDCRFVMKNFNDYQPLEASDIARYQSILLPAMAAVVHGAYEVVEYLKDIGVFFKFPPQLTDMNQEVYLRDCFARMPFN